MPVAVGLDHRDGELAVHGWTEGSGRYLDDALGLFPDGGAFVITDIGRDGMLGGPDVEGLAESVAAGVGPGDRQRGSRPISTTSPRSPRSTGSAGSSPARRSTKVASRRGRPRTSARPATGGGSRMKVARVIPCLDVTDGRVVKGINFVDLRDAGDPVELAARYDLEGADELVFLDITASSDDRDTMIDMVERIAEQVYIPFTVGGGIRRWTTPGRCCAPAPTRSASTPPRSQRPELITEIAAEFGAQCVVCAIDAKRRPDPPGGIEPAWEVYLHGGRTPTGIDAVEWAREAVARGAGEILLTSMDRDGTRDGFRPRADAVDRRRRRRAR